MRQLKDHQAQVAFCDYFNLKLNLLLLYFLLNLINNNFGDRFSLTLTQLHSTSERVRNKPKYERDGMKTKFEQSSNLKFINNSYDERET